MFRLCVACVQAVFSSQQTYELMLACVGVCSACVLACVQTVCFECVQAVFGSQQTYELMLACVQTVCCVCSGCVF